MYICIHTHIQIVFNQIKFIWTYLKEKKLFCNLLQKIDYYRYEIAIMLQSMVVVIPVSNSGYVLLSMYNIVLHNKESLIYVE